MSLTFASHKHKKQGGRLQIDETVRKLVKKYNTSDTFELAIRLDIEVSEKPLGDKIKGFYLYERRIKVITINSSLKKEEKIIVCGIGLGHAVLNPKNRITFLDNHIPFEGGHYQCEANKFCAYLLHLGSELMEYDNFSLEQVSAAKGILLGYLR